MASAARAARELLRAIDARVTSVASNRQWKKHVISEFRRHADLQSAADVDARLEIARDLAFLIRNIANHRVSLMFKHNLYIPEVHHGAVATCRSLSAGQRQCTMIGVC